MHEASRRCSIGPSELLLDRPRCAEGSEKKKKKNNATCSAAKEQRKLSWDLPDLQRGIGRILQWNCHGRIPCLPSCGPAAAPSYASCQRTAKCPTPGLLCHIWAVWQPQAYLLVGGVDWTGANWASGMKKHAGGCRFASYSHMQLIVSNWR